MQAIRKWASVGPLSAQSLVHVVQHPDAAGHLRHAQRKFISGNREFVEELRKAIDWEPSFKFTHVELADVYALKGMFQEAASEWARVEVLGGDTVTPEQLAAVHDTVGYKRSQELFIERQIASSKRKYRSPMNIALAYARLGNAEQVLTWLEEAYRQRAPGLSGLKVEPLFDFLRGNPRFQDLLRRMNFPD